MSGRCQISFPGTAHAPLGLAPREKLAEHLTVQNSPVLFGCRTGLCGTCVVTVAGDIPPPSADEAEILEVHAPDNPRARLACQLELTADITIEVGG